jgi:uncharacterized protein YndB with AHSA1/START domain
VPSFELSVDVARAPAEVFAYLTDTDRLPEWQSSAVEAQWQGEKAPGAHIREVRRFLGRRMETEIEVTAYEPDRRFGLRAISGPVPFSVLHVLEPRGGGGTTLGFSGEGDPGGFFKMAEPVVARVAERQFKNDFETLKDILEGGASQQ